PNLAGIALANTIVFAPPGGKTAAGAFEVGRVISSVALANGLQLTQTVGTSTVTSQLTFPHDGVMRYEVTDWNGIAPVESSITAPSDGTEHFYGFGEKFNGFDQAGKNVRVITFDSPGNKGDHSYKAVPWFISTRGYGFHLESSAESTFDMRAANNDR